MNFPTIKFRALFSVWLVCLAVGLFAQIPDGYYKAADNKSTASLKSALSAIIRKHTVLEYYTSSTYFRSTDWHPATTDVPGGYFWDMYSNNKRTSWTGMNREHSLPKSWWSTAPETTEAYSDLHNLYPSDAVANSAKSNFPLGEVAGKPDFGNGVTKVGDNGFPGYSGKVFEPADEYKGDFARDYMYMVTCYEDYAANWRSLGTSSMLLGGKYPVFRPWAVELLLKWHRNDPVSEKETKRNNEVFRLQSNRNPFIDHPELAEFIWGKYMEQPWSTAWVSPDEEMDFAVSPYPQVSGTMTVRVNEPDKCIYFIRTIAGVSVQSGHFQSDGTLYVGGLPNGLYLLEVYTTFNKRQVRKFIVRH